MCVQPACPSSKKQPFHSIEPLMNDFLSTVHFVFFWVQSLRMYYILYMLEEEVTDHDQTLYNCLKLKTTQNAGHLLIWRSSYHIKMIILISGHFVNFANCHSGSFFANCCSGSYWHMVALSLFLKLSISIFFASFANCQCNANLCCELCKLSFLFFIVFPDDFLPIAILDHRLLKICKVISRGGQNGTLSKNT